MQFSLLSIPLNFTFDTGYMATFEGTLLRTTRCKMYQLMI